MMFTRNRTFRNKRYSLIPCPRTNVGDLGNRNRMVRQQEIRHLKCSIVRCRCRGFPLARIQVPTEVAMNRSSGLVLLMLVGGCAASNGDDLQYSSPTTDSGGGGTT